MLSTTVKVGEVRQTERGPARVAEGRVYGFVLEMADCVHIYGATAVYAMPLLCPAPEDIRVGDVFEKALGRREVFDSDFDRVGMRDACLRAGWRIVKRGPEPAIATPAGKTDPLDAIAWRCAGVARHAGESDDSLRRRAREAIFGIAFGANVPTAFSPGAFGATSQQNACRAKHATSENRAALFRLRDRLHVRFHGPDGIRLGARAVVADAARNPPLAVLEFGQRKGRRFERYCRALADLLESVTANSDPDRITEEQLLACIADACR